MLNVGTPELLLILVVALVVLGPNRLPHAARQVGKAVGELRRISTGFQTELRDAMQEPLVMAPAEPEDEPPARPRRTRPLRAPSTGGDAAG